VPKIYVPKITVILNKEIMSLRHKDDVNSL